ncbi:MAG: fumarylacetoacetate hydrolase family protein [Streptosporangiaceae bacterium]
MPHPLGLAPSKIIAVHVNYRSRARERGRVPTAPSYFLKPPSSLAGPGDPLVRPRGCELLAFEGEIALVIGERARRVPRERAWGHVRWVTAANDAGVYDLRYADRGSNLRSKGADGFTPIGPRLLDASTVDPAALRLRTWVGGELVQDATTEELLFGFDLLLADLSRLVTLEPGDVLLTGTPTGSFVVRPGAAVEVEVSAELGVGPNPPSTGRLRNGVVEADHDLAAVGAMPHVDETTRAAAFGTSARAAASDPAGTNPTLTDDLRRTLADLSTATLSSQLRKRGMNGATIGGLRPTRPDRTMVGTARTLRDLPLREDLYARYGGGMNAQKRTIARRGPGDGRPGESGGGHDRRHPRAACPDARRRGHRDRRGT